ncbi:hypothetical protein JOQ06_017706 [Pogonophryne albipinna]|uniref:Uncharacterized protein n=1 Tax=Pogonophryne albipinna TaxID=1090488 RepID=A0AAD6F5A6_9TELE|nr:hypothetical protein JOQ06_017706 [Pogonophryne albipinna]
MTSFLNYFSPVERAVVEKALRGPMEESDEEDSLDLFTRMGSHFLPAKNNMEPAIETMAHEANLQEPKYTVGFFLTPISLVQLKLPDKDSALSLYEKKKATGRRHWVCFNAETGLSRRPVAHTCGATLEVPCSVLSNYFEVDIL